MRDEYTGAHGFQELAWRSHSI